jgi:hypothetical protein
MWSVSKFELGRWKLRHFCRGLRKETFETFNVSEPGVKVQSTEIVALFLAATAIHRVPRGAH